MYCTYLTIYSGDKLPPYYIGSSSIDKINKGYKGSVSSNEFKQIWLDELENNVQLFKTIILSKHETREEAFIAENNYHKKLDVVKNPLFMNKSYAISGCYGRSITKGMNKFNNASVAKHAKTMQGRNKFNDAGCYKRSIKRLGLNKHNCEWVRIGGEKQLGRTKETHDGVAKAAESRNKIPKHLRKIVIDRYENGDTQEQIVKWLFNDYNIQICCSTLSILYKREKNGKNLVKKKNILTTEMKQHIIQLKNDGLTFKDIKQWLFDNENIVMSLSGIKLNYHNTLKNFTKEL